MKNRRARYLLLGKSKRESVAEWMKMLTMVFRFTCCFSVNDLSELQ